MMRASLLPVSSAMSATASLIVPMSPFFVVPPVTPQSMRMCCGPAALGTVIRKKSPKPTRYMRMRSWPLPAPLFMALAGALLFWLAFLLGLLFFFCAAMSRSSLHQREIHLEVLRIVGNAELLAEAALAVGALRAEMPGDHVGQLRLAGRRGGDR